MWSYEELYRDVCVEFDLDCLWLNIIIAWYYSKVKNIINGEREREFVLYEYKCLLLFSKFNIIILWKERMNNGCKWSYDVSIINFVNVQFVI